VSPSNGRRRRIVTKISYIIFETYYVTIALFQYGFNWALVFLGLDWLLRELEKVSPNALGPHLAVQTLEAGFARYRTCQRINNILNGSFQL
jgi:hypothetical protein